MAPALAIESCWATTMAARPEKPAALRRSGGQPVSA